MVWEYSTDVLYRWHVIGRYEYWPIDLYRYTPEHPNGEMTGESIIIPRLSKKAATEVCGKLNQSLSYGEKLMPE